MSWRDLASEQPRQHDLAAGRSKQVIATNHEIHPMLQVVHDDGKLIGPVAGGFPEKQIAALVGGL